MVRTLGLELDGSGLRILDQRSLPHEEVWLPADEVSAMIDHIRLLRVRGAPMIGICAALCLLVQARRGVASEQLREAALALRAARPTAVNLMVCVDRLLAVIDGPEDPAEAVPRVALKLVDEDRQLCDRMADHGAALVEHGEVLLTHCNTGGLATAGVGTALGVIRRAHEQGKGVRVLVDETRPLLQGGRLTAWELRRLGIPHALIVDGAAASLMARGRVDRVFVGADRIAANGDTANKIGTYAVAVAAHHHGVPFHVVAPRTTVDLGCATGADIPIEEREAAEVRGARFAFGDLRWAPAECAAENPAFDVTPGRLVTSLVLDSGVVPRAALADDLLRSHLATPSA